jgi:UDP-glucose 4-epimerase
MEQLCLAQAANFGLEAVIVRLFSVYGPCLYKQLLWDLCSKFAADPVVLRLGGSGEERRDWIAVSDVARLLELAAKLAGKETLVLNGGTGVPTTVREIAQQVADAWGSRAAIEFTGLARPGDPFSLVADCRRIRELGFESSQTPQNGIPAYVRWFREYRKG